MFFIYLSYTFRRYNIWWTLSVVVYASYISLKYELYRCGNTLEDFRGVEDGYWCFSMKVEHLVFFTQNNSQTCRGFFLGRGGGILYRNKEPLRQRRKTPQWLTSLPSPSLFLYATDWFVLHNFDMNIDSNCQLGHGLINFGTSSIFSCM